VGGMETDRLYRFLDCIAICIAIDVLRESMALIGIRGGFYPNRKNKLSSTDARVRKIAQ